MDHFPEGAASTFYSPLDGARRCENSAGEVAEADAHH